MWIMVEIALTIGIGLVRSVRPATRSFAMATVAGWTLPVRVIFVVCARSLLLPNLKPLTLGRGNPPLSFQSHKASSIMSLLKEISRMPLHSEIFKHWEINYGQITSNHHPICHIMIYRLNTRYYIEMSGWYTGKTFWSAPASASLVDLYFEVKAIADERTFRSLKDYERRGAL